MGKLILILLLSISAYSDSIGSIMAMKGQAQIKRINELFTATNGMELEAKDEVITQARSKVQVILKDNTVITIGQNTSFVFEEFEYDESSNSKLSMKANRGFFRSVTGLIGKVAPERFKIKTRTATIGIRGTDFSGEITDTSELIKCYAGTIFVEIEDITRDIYAGMMMDITPNKIEIKKISSQQKELKQEVQTKKTKTKQTKSTNDSKSQGKSESETSAKTETTGKSEALSNSDAPVKTTADVSAPKIVNISVDKIDNIQIIEPISIQNIVEEDIVSIDISVDDVIDIKDVTIETVVDDTELITTIIEESIVVEEPVIVEDPVVEPVVTEPFDISPSSIDREKIY